MSKSHMVTCRVCKEKFDTNELPADAWCMPSKNFYYHQICYDNWAKKKKEMDIHLKESDDYWKELMWDYIRYDLKMIPDEDKLFSQWQRYIKKGHTAKGIFYTLYYFYEVQHGDKTKAAGGIGIVDYLYKEATQYWASMEHRQVGLLKSIEEQMTERLNRPEIKIKKAKTKQNKTRFSLEDIE